MRRRGRRNDTAPARPARRGVSLLIGVGAALLAAGSSTVWVERTAWLMGTTLTMTSAAPSAQRGMRALEAAFDSVRVLEDVLSTWRTDTELARLNAAPAGSAIRVTPRLTRLLAATAAWTRATGGAFDPAIGPLVTAWDLRGAGRRPETDALAAARAATGFRWFAVDSGAGTVRRLAPRASLDAGAFGKGAALDAAAAALRGAHPRGALLDFGGQVLALGTGPDGAAWAVDVADPRDRRARAVRLRLSDRSAATSAQSERYVTVGGEQVGHILDPRSGAPAPAWGSVTVVHESALAADVLATALYVMGPAAGPAWAAERRLAALFLIARAGRLDRICTSTMNRYLEENETCR